MRSADGPTAIITEEYDRESDEPVSARITRLVAIAADRDVLALGPLGRVIDVDALDALINSRTINDPETEIEVTFGYEGYLVEIDATGTVSILVENECEIHTT